MIDIKVLKTCIEEKRMGDSLLILVNNKSGSFLSNQYIEGIKNARGLDIEYVQDIKTLSKNSFDIFNLDSSTNKCLRVYKCDTFICNDQNILKEKDLIIVCNKYSTDLSLLENYVAVLPELEDWMIRDYVYSCAEGVDTKDLDWMIEVCKGNIDRINQEVNKLTLFEPSQRKLIFKEFIEDSMFEDLSSHTIFNITNALQSRDINTLKNILPEIKNIDVEAVGLVKILWQNFKKLIDVWLTPNPTPESTGLKPSQIYAINKLPRVFTKSQLFEIFRLLSTIDYRLKSGLLDASIIVDYLIINILSK